MPVLWAYRDPLGFPTKESKAWHALGFILRAAPSVLLIQDALLIFAYGFYFWIVFELAINYFTKKELFYMDKTSLTGEILNSFYISGKVIASVKFALMLLIIAIKYRVFNYLFDYIKNYITQYI